MWLYGYLDYGNKDIVYVYKYNINNLWKMHLVKLGSSEYSFSRDSFYSTKFIK